MKFTVEYGDGMSAVWVLSFPKAEQITDIAPTIKSLLGDPTDVVGPDGNSIL